MRYDSEKNIIEVSVGELVATARRGISVNLPKDENEPELTSAKALTQLHLEFYTGGLEFLLTAETLPPEGGKLAHTFIRHSGGGKPSGEERAQARGEAYVIAKMMLDKASDFGISSPLTLELHYEHFDTGEVFIECESITKERAERFFKKCARGLEKTARAEIERVSERLPSMKRAKFPYGEMRPAQNEFIRAAYRTIAKGGELYSEAPTGTGKTVSAIFPALRALGDGRADKTFYLTPKTTTAAAARDCLELFSSLGVQLRAIILFAKDRLCERGRLCRDGKGDCPAERQNRITEATYALFDMKLPVVDFSDIRRTARDFSTCPYELALSYSELCDIVICDFNYLFDPDVYIRRFFTRGGSYAFLIDEAHNLADRAREMYSAELSLSDIDALTTSEYLGEHSKTRMSAMALRERMRALLLPYLKDEIREGSNGELQAAYHTRNLPEELYTLFLPTLAICDEELSRERCAIDPEAKKRKRQLRDFFYKIKKLVSAINRFDDGFELFIFLNGDDIRLKIFCIDTGNMIKKRLALGKSAVFFSGTLTPLSYYRSVLGGDGSSATQVLPSPFVSEQLGVYVMDKVSTRYSEREDTLTAVSRIIAATLSAKRGNYMIFSPSFAYSEALYKFFKVKYPKIRSILQTPNMTKTEKDSFIAEFSKEGGTYLAAFSVMGGIFSEGIDLSGDKLIGAVVVGIGMPALSFEREAIAAYYDEKLEEGKQYAYIYPGMNRVLQAAGRVIRTETDRGVIVLVDDRFDDPLYKKTAPTLWRGMKFLSTAKDLKYELDDFWKDE